jgi:hypothetical protein
MQLAEQFEVEDLLADILGNTWSITPHTQLALASGSCSPIVMASEAVTMLETIRPLPL